MAFTIHGIGMMVYGERDYWPDGSFVTTEWVVFAYLPIAPIISERISYTRNSDYATYDSNGFYVYETTPSNRKQVVGTYAWFASFLALFFAWIYFKGAIETQIGDADKAAELWLTMLAIILALPYTLRRLAKRRKMRKWKRINAGLESPSSDE